MSKFESSKLIIPYLAHIQQPRFEPLVMFNISQIPKKYIWWSTSFKKIATLHTATSITLNSVTDIFLQILQNFQTRCSRCDILLMSKSEHMLKVHIKYEHIRTFSNLYQCTFKLGNIYYFQKRITKSKNIFGLHSVETYWNLIKKNHWSWA